MNFKEWLEAVAAMVVILGLPPIAWRHGKSFWDETLGARRSQARLLDRLACGEPIDRVNTWLGLPVYRNGHRHTYEMLGAWVQIVEQDGAVESFSITIVRERFHYNTRKLTWNHLTVDLGRASFAEVTAAIEPASRYCWKGARRVGYVEQYYFGNPANYQTYILAYNEAGCGYLGETHEEDGEVLPALGRTRANTLMVFGPNTEVPDMSTFGISMSPGVDSDEIRVRLV